MPTYDYACQTCGRQVEVTHRVHEVGPSICPRCGGPMRKLISAPAIHFKGSGWAKKDASDARSKPAASSSGANKESKAKDGDSTGTGASTSDGGSKPDSPPADGGGGSDTGVKPNAAD